MIERRRDPRFPFACTVRAASSAEGRSANSCCASVNISEGGICIVSDRSAEAGSVVSARLHLGDVPVSVPLLLQVQWVASDDRRAGRFRTGLRFLF